MSTDDSPSNSAWAVRKPIKLKNAQIIRPNERDYSLGLTADDWPTPDAAARLGSHWSIGQTTFQPGIGFPFRLISVDEDGGQDSPPGKHQLFEAIVRFPSAPLYHIHRKPAYQLPLERVNHHTFRLIRRPFSTPDPPQIRRLYMIHNGLNERDNLGTYYRIAHLMFRNEELRTGVPASESACLIRPIPGHLTRYPFPGEFAEKPMDRYLNDAGELFRQFLRFMLETQWLLSILVPFRDFRTLVGLNLLAQGEAEQPGRLDPAVLAEAIRNDWSITYEASRDSFSAEGQHGRDPGPEVSVDGIYRTIILTRWLLGWQGSDVWREPPAEKAVPPTLHTIGYSLGGFLAQSAFFTWPQTISTCTMLNSGGPLEDVQLSGFAHKEEWRRVLHALRYEIDTAMLRGALVLHGDTIAGTSQRYFSTFLRTFYEVFLQEFHGQYLSRVKEYVQRLLFVVGGSDPVVPPEAVIRRSPEGGINLIEIANLSHALHSEQPHWRRFWLPQLAGMIDRFAERGEVLLADTLHRYWATAAPADAQEGSDDPARERRATDAGSQGIDSQGNQVLSSEEMDDQLDRITSRLQLSRGWLFIAKNQVPEELLGENFLQVVGKTMHYEEGRVWHWNRGRLERGSKLWNAAARVVLMIPESAERDAGDEPAIVSLHPEATAGQAVTGQGRLDLHREFVERWLALDHSDLMVFDPRRRKPGSGGGDGEFRHTIEDLRNKVRDRLSYEATKDGSEFPVLINTLPDVWILIDEALTEEWAGPLAPTNQDDWKLRNEVVHAFVRWSLGYAGKKSFKTDMNKLGTALKDEKIRILKASRGEFNPRFRGVRVHDLREAARLIVHTALAYIHSKPMPPRRPGASH